LVNKVILIGRLTADPEVKATPTGVYVATMRLATNTLVFEDNGTVVRIEGNMTKDQALQIAQSLL